MMRGLAASPVAFAPRARRAASVATPMAAVLALILVVVFLHLPVYAYTLEPSILPKYFYFAFALLLAPVVLLNLQAFIAYLASPFCIWAMALLALNLLHLFSGAAQSARNIDVVSFRMQALAMVLVLGFAFAQAPRGAWQRVFVFIAMLIPVLLIVDFLDPGLIYPLDTAGAVIGRASATFINPTIAGEGVLLSLLFALPALKKSYRAPLILLSGIGVLLTFTRAAMIAWLALWLVLLLRRKLSRMTSIAVFAMALVPIALGGFQSYLTDRSDLSASIDNLQDRLSFFSHSRLADSSALEREAVLRAGWELFLQHPFEGAGAGATEIGATPTWPHDASTHNELILLGAEYGIVGLGFWCWLGWLIWRGRHFEDRVLQRCAFLLFLLMTPFTHNMFDFPYWLLSFAFLTQRSAAAGTPRRAPRTRFAL